MHRLYSVLVAVIFAVAMNPDIADADDKIAIAIHGGAGTIAPGDMTPELEQDYLSTLSTALDTGYELLRDGASSLDTVVAVIRIMEDSPLFNAGKGAVFTSNGIHELDASVMDGRTLNAGAVGAIRYVRNPIDAARLVMDKSPHVMLIGEGAQEFAFAHGLERVPMEYFYTERRWQQLQKVKELEKTGAAGLTYKFGTVGAVALDKDGDLAAGTSTGGTTNKRFGRIGDSPIIGAGNYANNSTCAVSGTGQGEYFIRSVVGHDISALMEYRDATLEEAARRVVLGKLVDLGGEGGVIAVDKDGNVALEFNSAGMYRGAVDAEGRRQIAIYADESWPPVAD